MSHRLRRAVRVISGALLALMLVGPGAVNAATPGWYFTITSLNPPMAKVGSNAAWSVTITNGGTSNISALYLSTDLPKNSSASYPTYVGNTTYLDGASGPANPCNAAGTGPLFCDFGNLVAGGSVTIDVIAFTVANASSTCTDPSTSVTYPCYAFNFVAFGNGNTPSDKGNKSHGDTLFGPVSVGATTSGDYAGGFSLDDSPVSNDGLSRGNRQSETVNPPTGSSLIQVTIQDGLLCETSDTWCTGGFGDVMRLNVDQGNPFATGIKVVIVIDGKLVPGGTSTSDIDLIHQLDDETYYTISLRCDGTTTLDAAPGGPECITVTKIGPNFQVVAWLARNGGLRLF